MANFKPLDSLKTVRECALKLLEEASEACEAMKDYDKLGSWGKTDGAYAYALAELADVSQCLCNCLYSLDARQGEFDDAAAHVQKHNAERGRHEVEHPRTLTIDWHVDGATCHNLASGYDGDDFRCSKCGEVWELTCGTPEENNLHFCPNCGARVVGENE